MPWSIVSSAREGDVEFVREERLEDRARERRVGRQRPFGRAVLTGRVTSPTPSVNAGMRSSQKPRKWFGPTMTATSGRAARTIALASARPARKAIARSLSANASQCVFINVVCDAPTPTTIIGAHRDSTRALDNVVTGANDSQIVQLVRRRS